MISSYRNIQSWKRGELTKTPLSTSLFNPLPGGIPLRFLPLIDCELDKDMSITPEVADAMVCLHAACLAIRPVCQLGALCQYSINLGLPVEMGVDHWSGGADTWLMWQDKVLGYGGSNCRVNPALYEGI